jgi:6-phosphogluconate dehydrogenase (decarboxylating)
MDIAMIGLGKMGAKEAPFGDKLLAAMRNRFGGHAVKGAK